MAGDWPALPKSANGATPAMRASGTDVPLQRTCCSASSMYITSNASSVNGSDCTTASIAGGASDETELDAATRRACVAMPCTNARQLGTQGHCKHVPSEAALNLTVAAKVCFSWVVRSLALTSGSGVYVCRARRNCVFVATSRTVGRMTRSLQVSTRAAVYSAERPDSCLSQQASSIDALTGNALEWIS